ncbi:MAG: hypothetical protein WCV55_02715 [Candidatus Paceibacterota bacterium]
MELISSFLERFKNIKDPKQDRIDIAQIISNAIGEEIKESLVNEKNGVIFLQISPMLKTQIFMNKEKIIETLNVEKPNLHIKDVR